MQDQGKRLLLAVALALGVMLVWNMIFPSKQEEPPKPTPGSGSQVVKKTPEKAGDQSTGSSATPDPAKPDGSKPTDVAKPVEAPCKDSRATLAFPSIEASFSTCGASLVGWKLTDPRYAEDVTTNHGQLVPQFPDAGAFQVNYRQGNGMGRDLIPARAEWTESARTPTSISYTYKSPNLDVTKTFTIHPDNYMVEMTVSASPHLEDGYMVPVVTVYGYQDPKTDSESGNARVQPRVWQSASLRSDGTIATTTVLEIHKDGPRREPSGGSSLVWTGFEHPYLLVGYAPVRTSENELEKHTREIDPQGLIRTDIWFGQVHVKKGDPDYARKVVAYLGPKNFELLDHVDEVAGFSTGFKDTIDFGHFPLLGFSLAFIGKPLLWLLAKFYSLVGNWGISIILLTLCVKLATLYWTTKSMRSMKAMAAVAPQMKALQEKYKDDRQRLQAETMGLYKQNNVNPLAGCLPIFLQIPIWSALYIMLSATGELYLEPFIPGWINDLTNTDPLHILPVLLVVTMFVQARLTPTTSTDRSQKFIQYGMPLMFGVMSFFFPSGLTLYIFTNTVLSSLHGIYMNKYDKKSLDLMAKLKKNATDAAAAKAAAAATPAKPIPKAKVIDVKANEDDDDDEAAPAPSASAAANPARARRRKKRRR